MRYNSNYLYAVGYHEDEDSGEVYETILDIEMWMNDDDWITIDQEWTYSYGMMLDEDPAQNYHRIIPNGMFML